MYADLKYKAMQKGEYLNGKIDSKNHLDIFSKAERLLNIDYQNYCVGEEQIREIQKLDSCFIKRNEGKMQHYSYQG